MWPTLYCGGWECWPGSGSLWSSLLSLKNSEFLSGYGYYGSDYPSFMVFILKRLGLFLVVSYVASIIYVKMAGNVKLRWFNSKPYWLKGGVLAIVLFLVLVGVDSLGDMGGGLLFLILYLIMFPLTYIEDIIPPIFLILPYIFLLGTLAGFVVGKIKSKKLLSNNT